MTDTSLLSKKFLIFFTSVESNLIFEFLRSVYNFNKVFYALVKVLEIFWIGWTDWIIEDEVPVKLDFVIFWLTERSLLFNVVFNCIGIIDSWLTGCIWVVFVVIIVGWDSFNVRFEVTIP